MRNRKTLVSVFNPQEAREAVLGGARIVDSEDPRSALGNIKPYHIMQVSDAVLNYKRNEEVQLSTNIGEDQLLFKRSETGQAIEKSPYEISGKAAQAALGVATAMGTRVHPCNLVKVGLDGMKVQILGEVLEEVVNSLNKTEQFSHAQVMSVLFVQDLSLWEDRKQAKSIIDVLIGLREFYPCYESDDKKIDLLNYAVNTLRDRDSNILFTDKSQVSLGALIKRGVLQEGSNHAYIKLNELFPHYKYFNQINSSTKKTTKEVIKAMVDVTADSGADAIMLDTSVLSKVSGICLVDTSSNGMIDLNQYDLNSEGTPVKGILSLEDIKYFVDYCHYRGIEANLAGSIQSYQAQQLWLLVPEIDQISTRGGASAVTKEPNSTTTGSDTRQFRVIKRNMVRGIVPPEHDGVLNIPVKFKSNSKAMNEIAKLKEMLIKERAKQNLPELKSYFIDSFGEQTEF